MLAFGLVMDHLLCMHDSDDQFPINQQVPAGFNKFEYPAIKNSFYGDGIPFGQVSKQHTLHICDPSIQPGSPPSSS